MSYIVVMACCRSLVVLKALHSSRYDSLQSLAYLLPVHRLFFQIVLAWFCYMAISRKLFSVLSLGLVVPCVLSISYRFFSKCFVWSRRILNGDPATLHALQLSCFACSVCSILWSRNWNFWARTSCWYGVPWCSCILAPLCVLFQMVVSNCPLNWAEMRLQWMVWYACYMFRSCLCCCILMWSGPKHGVF